MINIFEQLVATKRISNVQKLNSKFPNWNANDIEMANNCLNNLADYKRNEEGYQILIANIKLFGNSKLAKKAAKFALKVGIMF